ncbi:MAG: hypothetical protein BGN88_12545 [Clostridiales bacterium 43-6]|nr:MAG: hypothetical protein BGN88_12545 [Clostridiales bacterium 43-6]
MSVFHQIGHHSINLVKEELLHGYQGIVLSPLNNSEEEITHHNSNSFKKFKKIFDPQLYFPKTERSGLKNWCYFPNDFDTADLTNYVWWNSLCDNLFATAKRTTCDAICSPVIIPKIFSGDYYRHTIEVGNYLYNKSTEDELDFYQTVVLNMDIMAEHNQAEIISSIITQTNSNKVYLIIKSDIEPRRELQDVNQIVGIMKFIRYLSDAGISVLVGFCSSEFLLWKYAGATAFASGKFFNLRRFTSSRFDEPSGGGGQLPYWFERNLFAYLREGDVLRLKKEGLLNECYRNNPYSVEILKKLDDQKGEPWISLSWKNYLFSFYSLDKDFEDKKDFPKFLAKAEKNWLEAEDNSIFMEEVRNNGDWIRKWRISINEYNKAFD